MASRKRKTENRISKHPIEEEVKCIEKEATLKPRKRAKAFSKKKQDHVKKKDIVSLNLCFLNALAKQMQKNNDYSFISLIRQYENHYYGFENKNGADNVTPKSDAQQINANEMFEKLFMNNDQNK